MIITIDGPVATGKSTIARQVANSLGFIFFDTGSMYRCITYALIKQKVNIDDVEEVKSILKNFQYVVADKEGEKHYYVNQEDVTQEIRKEAVTLLVSKVSAMHVVREKLVSLQRNLAVGVNAVFEGRDMGSVVFPNAELKIFLTGRPEVRAKRRFDELRAKFPKDTENLTLEAIIEDLDRRDTYDSTRKISPLTQPIGAYVIDTSDLTLEEVVDKILNIQDQL